MKKLKLLLVCLFITISLQAQTLKLFWDLDGNQSADVTYTCSDGDTLTAYLYLANTDTSNIVAGKPIYVFEIPVLYGYYTRWSSNEDYSNILTLSSAIFDTTAFIDSTGIFVYSHNSDLKRFNLSYRDTASTAIIADSCIGIFTFIVSGTGNQLLHFNYLGEENNYTMQYNVAVLNNRLVNYSLWVRDCKIISQ